MWLELRAAIKKSTAIFDKEKAHKRLSKLSGGVTIFKVRKAGKAEVGERKDRVTDALKATRAAVEKGIVPGQKLLGKMQNMIKEFKNFVLQVFLFFNICNHS
ncbi:chaperonin CPN60-like 2, mitochondrial [Camellia sinensis]|uniref:chaperonin CPN60-like 2, mitochondrial n=1 Tax=Camellia sinensis TaxID=4442 RepID=UPI0010362DD2|nr:chaperonin CPN60-like 2, mitochondrial [Camellia sinensis]